MGPTGGSAYGAGLIKAVNTGHFQRQLTIRVTTELRILADNRDNRDLQVWQLSVVAENLGFKRFFGTDNCDN